MRKTLVTIDGHIGSGAFDVGKKISRMFGLTIFRPRTTAGAYWRIQRTGPSFGVDWE